MARHHHVNLGVEPGGLDAERAFLVDILGYHKIDLPDQVRAVAPSAQWYETDDGSQIHLSEDPKHRAPERAHVAIELDAPDFAEVRHRLESASMAFDDFGQRSGLPPVLILKDPAGNRWELRGPVD